MKTQETKGRTTMTTKTNYDTCYLGSCWEPFQTNGDIKLTKLYAYRINRETRFALTEEEATRIVERASK
jgi:hypothetical protein